jgi:integrase
MSWSHITPDSKIVVSQQKTGRRLLIPLHRDLVATLAVAKREHISILTTMFGKPFTVDGFSQWMRDAITEAELPLGCQPHGLRKATGRRLAEAGATAKMIMSVLGHTTLAEAERYPPKRLIRRVWQRTQSSSLKDTRRTGLPKPLLKVWEKYQKAMENQSESKWAGAPFRTNYELLYH